LICKPEEDQWFWIEPYVHAVHRDRKLLLYNTLSGEKIEYINQPAIMGLFRKLRNKKKLRVIRITKNQLKNPTIHQFIKEMKQRFMGDMETVSHSTVKPIQLTPVQNIQSDVNKVKKGYAARGKKVMSNLSEVTLYINNYSETNRDIHHRYSRHLYKQYLFPMVESAGQNESKGDRQETKQKQEMPLSVMKRLLEEIKPSAVKKINIAGGNPFHYPRWDKMLTLLNKVSALKTFHAHLRDAGEYPVKVRSIEKRIPRYSLLHLHVTFPLQVIDKEIIESILRTMDRDNVTFNFSIGGEEEMKECEEIIDRFQLAHVIYRPYYDGSNLQFFKDNVFITQETIMEARPTQKELLIRRTVNENYFGKLTILSNGDVYADINAPSIGNTGRESLHQIVYRELYNGKSWRRVRSRLLPCKKCLYRDFCPPPYNYETLLGRNNLCHVFNE